MSINSALIGGPFEGAFFCARQPYSPVDSPPYPTGIAPGIAYVAAPGGLIQGRFGWADPTTGQCSNVYAPNEQLGIVQCDPRGGYSRVCYDATVLPAGGWRIRAGLPVTLYLGGPFYLRFASGAVVGQQVYASPVDGQAISGQTSGAIATRWTVCSPTQPGGLAIVSSTAFFGA
jgi:hypothetical protein